MPVERDIKLRKRGDTYHLVRRVPQRYRSVESRPSIWITLRTDSEALAKQKAAQTWARYIEGWEAQLAGDTADAERQFQAAHDLAQARGFRWLTATKVATLPREALLERVEASTRRDGTPDKAVAAAVLGGAKEPGITVRRALELYWDLAADKAIGKSEDQVRRWKNPRIKAIDNFIKVVGDKPLASITGDDMLNFRQWWMNRLLKEGLTPNSANKDIGYIGSTFRLVNRLKRLGLVLPLDDLTFEEGDDNKRPPFSEEWIRNKLLATGAFDGMNQEARDIVLTMVNTGCRPSEIAGLLPAHIFLSHSVPHISILPEGKHLKAGSSKRIIPLVGISLEAMQRHPEGFPNYRFKDRISATANSYLRENGLLETDKHTLYSLRHSFEDRMLHAKIDERIRRDLMGHSLGGRERYGNGATLPEARDLLEAIAY